MPSGTPDQFHVFDRERDENFLRAHRFDLGGGSIEFAIDGDRCVVEALETGRGPRLLVVVPAARAPGRGWRLNDQPLPRVAVLRDGDVLMVAGGDSFRVALFRRPSIGPAGAALAGRECPVCRTPLAAETRVFRCPCGAALHDEEAGARPAGEALECARLGAECPSCGRAIVLEEGYASDSEA